MQVGEQSGTRHRRFFSTARAAWSWDWCRAGIAWAQARRLTRKQRNRQLRRSISVVYFIYCKASYYYSNSGFWFAWYNIYQGLPMWTVNTVRLVGTRILVKTFRIQIFSISILNNKSESLYKMFGWSTRFWLIRIFFFLKKCRNKNTIKKLWSFYWQRTT
jgi:hypothetical protein